MGWSTSHASAIHFDYDDSGRLIQLVLPSASAQYGYDVAGNLLTVRTDVLAIAGFSPNSGTLASQVTIIGNGFSATAASNQVKVNGTAAVVTAATANSLTFTVPAGATSGKITVTVASVTAASDESFSIVSATSAAEPVVSAVSTQLTTPGSSVTISGSNFTGSDIWVRINGLYATITSSSTTQLVFNVPTGATSGALVIGTRNGAILGNSYIYIPPSGAAVSDIGSTNSLVLDGAALSSAIAPGKKNLVLFDAIKGQGTHLIVTNNTINDGRGSADSNVTAVAVYAPDGSLVMTRSLVSNDPRGSVLQLANLPQSGTYTVMVSPSGQDAGSVSLQLRTPGSGTAVPTDGNPSSISVAARDVGYYSFSATQARGYRLTVSALSFTSSTSPTLQVFVQRPDGAYSGKMCSFSASQLTCDLAATDITVSGQYTLEINPLSPNGVSFTLAMTGAEDAVGTLTLDSPAVTATLQAGQRARYTFESTQGQGLHLLITNNLLNDGSGTADPNTTVINVYGPDGSLIAVRSLPSSDPRGSILQLPIQTLVGTYTVLISPGGQDAGAISLQLRSPGSGTTLPADGTLSSITIGAKGIGYYSFAGTQSQGYVLSVSSLTFSSGNNAFLDVFIQKPDGSYSGQACTFSVSQLKCVIAPTLVTDSGNYTLEFNPRSPNGASFLAALTGDVLNSLTLDGPTVTATLKAGQNASYTFAAAQGQSLHLVVSNNMLNDGTGIADPNTTVVSVFAPNGSLVFSRSLPSNDPRGSILQLTNLLQAGIYTVQLKSAGQDAGSISMQLRTPGSGSTVVMTGASTTVNVPVRNVGYYSFSGTQGQGYRMALSALTFTSGSNPYLDVFIQRPDGAYSGQSCTFSASQLACDILPSTLASSGKYTLEFNPRSPNGASFKVTLIGDALGALTVDGAASTVPLLAEQKARYTFTASLGQSLHLLLTNNVFNDGTGNSDANVTTVYVYAPDGSLVNSQNLPSNASRGAFMSLASLPQSGTYTIMVTPGGLDTGSIDLQLRTPGAGTVILTDGTISNVNVAARNLGYYSFNGTQAQSYRLTLSSLTFTTTGNATMDVTLQKPDGSSSGQACTFSNSQLTCDIPSTAMTMTGRYTLVFNPRSPNGASFKAALTLPGSIDPTQPSVGVDADTPIPLWATLLLGLSLLSIMSRNRSIQRSISTW